MSRAGGLRIKQYFLEFVPWKPNPSPADPRVLSFRLRWAPRLRLLVWVLIIAAAFFVFFDAVSSDSIARADELAREVGEFVHNNRSRFSDLDASGIARAVEHQYRESRSFQIDLYNFGLPVMIGVIHLFYMYVVSSYLVLGRPLSTIRFGDALFPLFLAAAYILTAVHAYRYGSSLILLGLSAFVALYVIWAARDLIEFRNASKENSQRKLWGWWAFVDVILAVFMTLLLLKAWGGFTMKPDWLLNKDAAIIAALIVWFFFDVFRVALFGTDTYRNLYTDYIRHIVPSGKEGGVGNGWKWSSGAPIASQQLKAALSKADLIVDFGCGDGKRLSELFKACGIDQKHRIVGFERRHGWLSDWRSAFPGGKFFTDLKDVRDAITSIGDGKVVLHLSHVLYDVGGLDRWRGVRNVLDDLADGSVVIVRGADSASLFMLLSKAFSFRVIRPVTSYLWVKKRLAPLAAQYRLILSSSGLVPVATVQQQYPTKEDSRDAACAFIELIYGRNPAEVLRQHLEQMEEAGYEYVANDDVIFVLTKGAESGGALP